MTFDFDPFSHLDINADGIIDGNDLKIWELQHGYPPSLHDLNHDGIPDDLQTLDFNGDGFSDKLQVDIDQSSVLDKFEQNLLGAKFTYNLNGDEKVDYIDQALARVLFPK